MSDTLVATTRVDHVTLYEDRAEVTRRGDVVLPAGTALIALRGLPPLVDATRLRARFEAQGRPPAPGPGELVQVDDLRTRPRWVHDDTAGGRRTTKIALELRQLERGRQRAESTERRAYKRRQEAERLLARYQAAVAESQWAGKSHGEGGGVPTVKDGFVLLEERLRRADRRVDEARREGERAGWELGLLERALTEGQGKELRLLSDLELRVTCAEAGTYTLLVAYVIPCAMWRPIHEAHLVENDAEASGPRVDWSTLATVWQKTGEDWDDVSLTLSTARPSADARLPGLEADELHLRTKAPEERGRVFVQHREESVPTRDLGGAAPGVDDGGEVRELRPPGRVRIASDGRPHQVAAGTSTSAAAMDLVAVPELDGRVYLKATLANASDAPLLAGPVTLRRNGAFVGLTDIPFIGARERFAMSFGSDERFEVRSLKKRLDEDKKLGRDRRHYVHEVFVRYLGREPQLITLQVRLPVSELKQVRVVPSEAYCSHGLPRPDESGLCSIRLEARPGRIEKASVGFSFAISGEVFLPDPW